MEFSLLKDLVLLFGLALVTVVLFRQFKLPSIIGFLCTGIVAGPYALGLIKDTHQVEQMAEIGVVLLLFTIGIEFSLKELLRIKHLVLWGGGLQVGCDYWSRGNTWVDVGLSLATVNVLRVSCFPFQYSHPDETADGRW